MKHFEAMQYFYKEESDEAQRLSSKSIQHLEFLTATKYLQMELPPKAYILDSCAGTGAYAFFLAEKGHRVFAGDILPHHVAQMRVQQAKTPVLAAAEELDAQELSRFPCNTFQAVLCMGALYHSHQKQQRQALVQQALRVLQPGGLLVCSYMNRYAVIMNNILPDFSNIDDAMQFAKKGVQGIYYAATPREMAALMAENGLCKCWHLPLDGMAYFMAHTCGIINSEEAFENWKKYHFAVCEDESTLGSSYHNLFIGRKPYRS